MIKSWLPHANHIIKTIDQIFEFQTRGDIETDELVYAGTLRNLHTISESVGQIPNEIQEMHPNIPWRQIRGFRNFIVHNYLGNNIDINVIKAVLNKNLPELKEVIEIIIAQQDA